MQLPSGKALDITLENFIPRGALVRGPKGGVVVLVVATGVDTKLVLNQGKPYYKISSTEKSMNIIFLRQIFQIFGVAAFCAVMARRFIGENLTRMPYVFEGIEPGQEGLYSFAVFFSSWLILVRFLPFDVVFQTETSKIIYAKFIENDANMIHFDEEDKEYITAKVQSMQIIEEAGKVDHLFCDKTGTLTQNDLTVKAFSVNGRLCKGESMEEINKKVADTCPDQDAFDLFLCFCLCNEVRVGRDETTGAIEFDGASQEEIIFLQQCQVSSFFELVKTDQYTMSVLDKRSGATKVYKKLRNIAFSSKRKMQTMVVQPEEGGPITVYSKGADMAIYPRLAGEDNDAVKQMKDSLDKFAANGLRTLCFAIKHFDSSVLPEHIESMEESMIESNFRLTAVSGMEDRLQEDVFTCIKDFQAAGIRTWILTGDKDSTAKSIGYQCGILDENREVVQINDIKHSEMTKFLESLETTLKDKDALISGTAVNNLMDAIRDTRDSATQKRYVKNFLQCKGFVVYRSSPAEKASVVRFVREFCPG